LEQIERRIMSLNLMKLPASHFKIAIVCLLLANQKTGELIISARKLADLCRVSRIVVRTALKNLTELGLLIIEDSQGKQKIKIAHPESQFSLIKSEICKQADFKDSPPQKTKIAHKIAHPKDSFLSIKSDNYKQDAPSDSPQNSPLSQSLQKTFIDIATVKQLSIPGLYIPDNNNIFTPPGIPPKKLESPSSKKPPKKKADKDNPPDPRVKQFVDKACQSFKEKTGKPYPNSAIPRIVKQVKSALSSYSLDDLLDFWHKYLNTEFWFDRGTGKSLTVFFNHLPEIVSYKPLNAQNIKQAGSVLTITELIQLKEKVKRGEITMEQAEMMLMPKNREIN